jgi:hypothetical protein
MRKPSQGAANCDRFEALIVGSQFSMVYFASKLGHYILADVYHKIGPDLVQASDGRQWNLAQTGIPNGGSILVPYGDSPLRCDVRRISPFLQVS